MDGARRFTRWIPSRLGAPGLRILAAGAICFAANFSAFADGADDATALGLRRIPAVLDGEPGVLPASHFANVLSRDMFQEDPAPPFRPDLVAGAEAVSEAESLGQQPEDNSLVFLRQQTVLLAPGEWQVDVGVEYVLTDRDFPIGIVDPVTNELVGVTESRLRRRLLLTPIELRYGVTHNLQAFVNVPIGWSNTELAFPGFDEFENLYGLGDVNFGLSALVWEGACYHPDVVVTLGVTAPTADATYPLTPLAPQSQLGQGYWALSANVLMVQNFDPIVLFYGAGYRYRFENEFDNGLVVEPGQQVLYQFGVGFAVNAWVTLSTSFLGMYISEDYVNGERREGSILEPMQLRFAATISKGCRIVEPFAYIGMTEDAPDAHIGITWTF